MDKMRFFEAAERVPEKFLSRIKGGNLSGKHSIDPQWRIRKLTELFGPCGQGWKVEPVRFWTEPGPNETVAAFCQVNLYWREDPQGPWSDPVSGIGGNQLVQKFSRGLNLNDECYKMAMTDAISVACKALGVGSLIYEGAFDGDKYSVPIPDSMAMAKTTPAARANGQALDNVTEAEAIQAIQGLHSYKDVCTYMQGKSVASLTPEEAERVRKFALNRLGKINEASLSEWTQVFTEADPDLVTSESFAGFEDLSPSVQKRLALKFSEKFPGYFAAKGLR